MLDVPEVSVTVIGTESEPDSEKKMTNICTTEYCVFIACVHYNFFHNQRQRKRISFLVKKNNGPEQTKRAYDIWEDEGVSAYKTAKT